MPPTGCHWIFVQNDDQFAISVGFHSIWWCAVKCEESRNHFNDTTAVFSTPNAAIRRLKLPSEVVEIIQCEIWLPALSHWFRIETKKQHWFAKQWRNYRICRKMHSFRVSPGRSSSVFHTHKKCSKMTCELQSNAKTKQLRCKEPGRKNAAT